MFYVTSMIAARVTYRLRVSTVSSKAIQLLKKRLVSNRYNSKVQRNITLKVAVKVWSKAFIQPFIAKTKFSND